MMKRFFWRLLVDLRLVRPRLHSPGLYECGPWARTYCGEKWFSLNSTHILAEARRCLREWV